MPVPTSTSPADCPAFFTSTTVMSPTPTFIVKVAVMLRNGSQPRSVIWIVNVQEPSTSRTPTMLWVELSSLKTGGQGPVDDAA